MENIEKFKFFMKWLNGNEWNVIFLLIAILSIIISIYLYLKAKRRKKPIFCKRSVNVVSDSIQSLGDIKVTYLNKPIENLTITKVAIWNSGNETLNCTDQAPSDKLRIEAEEGIKIFNAEIIYESNPTNNFNVHLNSNVIDFFFDFFDQNQGCIVKIIHSGKKSDNILIKGTFKGVGNIIEMKMSYFDFLRPIILIGTSNERRKRHFVNIMSWTIMIVGLFFFLLSIFTDLESKPLDLPIYSITGLIYAFIGFLSIFRRKSLPKGFDSFYGDE